jgi:hypothetical protein
MHLCFKTMFMASAHICRNMQKYASLVYFSHTLCSKYAVNIHRQTPINNNTK